MIILSQGQSNGGIWRVTQLLMMTAGDGDDDADADADADAA